MVENKKDLKVVQEFMGYPICKTNRSHLYDSPDFKNILIENRCRFLLVK